jgi:hypothetical protein
MVLMQSQLKVVVATALMEFATRKKCCRFSIAEFIGWRVALCVAPPWQLVVTVPKTGQLEPASKSTFILIGAIGLATLLACASVTQ